MPIRIRLTDDGTLDTVLRCSDCGEQIRYNYDPTMREEVHCDEHEAVVADCEECWHLEDDAAETDYDAFIASCIEDAEAAHVCGLDEDEEQ